MTYEEWEARAGQVIVMTPEAILAARAAWGAASVNSGAKNMLTKEQELALLRLAQSAADLVEACNTWQMPAVQRAYYEELQDCLQACRDEGIELDTEN